MRLNVAILLFDDVEVLDFAGPFEVFAVTDELSDYKLFNVFTVAESPGSVRARGDTRASASAAPTQSRSTASAGSISRALRPSAMRRTISNMSASASK